MFRNVRHEFGATEDPGPFTVRERVVVMEKYTKRESICREREGKRTNWNLTEVYSRDSIGGVLPKGLK